MEEQTRKRRTESVPIHLDNCTQITIGEISRLQQQGGKGYAFIYDKNPDDVIVAFRIERITDGRGRYWQCDGKLTVSDRAFGVSDFPLEWRRSNLGRGGFWVIVGAGHYARKLYRTPHGWRTFQEYKTTRTDYDFKNNSYHGHILYETQKESRASREGRGHHGFGKVFQAIKFEDLADEVCSGRYRKWMYRGKPTPYGKRVCKRFAKLKPIVYNKILSIANCTPELMMYGVKYALTH